MHRKDLMKYAKKKKRSSGSRVVGNHGTHYGGRWYQSKKEARYAEDLDWRIKAGEVIKWEPQFKLELIINDHRIANYRIDFKVYLVGGGIEYVEVKGFWTDRALLIWKITEALWPNIPGVEDHAQLVVVQ